MNNNLLLISYDELLVFFMPKIKLNFISECFGSNFKETDFDQFDEVERCSWT